MSFSNLIPIVRFSRAQFTPREFISMASSRSSLGLVGERQLGLSMIIIILYTLSYICRLSKIKTRSPVLVIFHTNGVGLTFYSLFLSSICHHSISQHKITDNMIVGRDFENAPTVTRGRFLLTRFDNINAFSKEMRITSISIRGKHLKKIKALWCKVATSRPYSYLNTNHPPIIFSIRNQWIELDC